MIDLSTLKAGQTVKFRCDGEAIVKSIRPSSDTMFAVYYVDSTPYHPDFYKHNGALYLEAQSIFDIVEIIPAPFNWDDVKPGDRFKDLYGNLHIYIGEDHHGTNVFSKSAGGWEYIGCETCEESFTYTGAADD